MLRNERYRGVQVWNRTEKQRNPETGRKISKQRPASDWVRVNVPEWRIVSMELWNGVQSRIRVINEHLGVSRYGGTTRTSQSRQYLFSGLLICGICGSRLVIVSGNGRRGYVKYGCPSHRYRGVCSNRLTMRQDRLEAQLLSAIAERVLTPIMIDYAVRPLQQQAKFDAFIEEFNQERPHEALQMKCPAEVYTASTRPYQGIPEPHYPFHDRTVMVTSCGRLCLYRQKINLSKSLAGQAVGVKEVDSGIWLVTFMGYDLGYIDLEEKTLQPLENPFGPKVSPMS
jgi:hypothetical protein